MKRLIDQRIYEYELDKAGLDSFLERILQNSQSEKEIIKNLIKKYQLLVSHDFYNKDPERLGKNLDRINKRLVRDIQRKANWKPVKKLDVMDQQKLLTLANCASEVFYSSTEWKKFRFYVLSRKRKICTLCGSDEHLQVDHIKPRSLFPELAFVESNMQLLCRTCNFGKGLGKTKTSYKIRKTTV